MNDKYTFIDLDGVILDSQERMLEKKEEAGFLNHDDPTEFDNYFKIVDDLVGEWDYILGEAKPINNSIEIIKELESMKKRIAILTKINTLKEMKLKVEILRDKQNIYVPIIFVPPGIEKYEIVIPNGQILIDDSRRNIYGWNNHCGNGILFNKNIECSTNDTVNSLEFLLKR